MFIFVVINRIKEKLRYHKIKRYATLTGEEYKFKKGALVLLADGSKKTDILLCNNVCLYGTLSSQSGGKITLGDNTRLGKNSIIRSVENVSVGSYTAISDGVIITDNNNHPLDPTFRRTMKLDSLGGEMRMWKNSEFAPIVIGENVWIGENSRIQKGVHIGDNAIVAAGAIVTKNVPANSVVAGIPAKVIKYI